MLTFFLPGLRLAEKRSLPCPRRNEWLAARDQLYEDIMEKAWNKEHQFFGQSYEDIDVLDSSLLIMPLVFFSTPVRVLDLYCRSRRVDEFDSRIPDSWVLSRGYFSLLNVAV